MTVIYADSVFLLNGLMDYLILMAAGRLTGVPVRRVRCILAALLGGGYAVAVFLPGMGFLTSPWVKLAALVLMTLLAFGGEPRLLRMLLVVLGISCGLAGAVLVLGLLSGGVPMAGGVFYTDVSPRILLIAATAAYLVLSVVFRASASHGIQGKLLPVQVCLGGKTQQMTALWDTGNGLRDPASNQPVLVASAGSLDEILPKGLRFLLAPEQLLHPTEAMELISRAAPELHPRLYPYHAVGVRSGLMLGIRVDWIMLGGTRYPDAAIGLSPTDFGGGYSALWGGEVKGEPHESRKNQLAADSDTAGSASIRWNPLHRGQRHTAVALGQSQRDGAAGSFGSGRSSQGTDRT